MSSGQLGNKEAYIPLHNVAKSVMISLTICCDGNKFQTLKYLIFEIFVHILNVPCPKLD